MWTRFMDMHSGGGSKEKWENIYIEASEDEAKVIFYNRFGHSPERASCTCCGDDYSIDSADSLREATAYERGCAHAYIDKDGNEVSERKAWVSGKGLKKGYRGTYVERADTRYSFREYVTLDEYLASGKALCIYADDIKPNEREGDVPEQGYVWRD